MKTIIINSKKHGAHTVLLDDEDYEKVNQYKWSILNNKNNLYIIRIVLMDGKQKMIYLHRFIMNTQKGYVTDHINHNTFDNQKYNLRNCTDGQNKKNITSRTGSTSKYLGVHWFKRDNVWIASITSNRKQTYLGRFTNEKNAALAYNEAAKVQHGEFAHLNVIQR